MESGAMALDFHTLGRVKLWGGQLVQHCGRSYSDIAAHGTNLNNLQTAWKYYGYTLTIKSGHTWADLLADLKAGHGVVLQGDYDQLSYGAKCQKNFYGAHGIYLNPEFYGTAILMMDPLCGSPKWVSNAELRNFAEKFGRLVFPYSQNYQKICYAITAAHPTTAPAPTPTTHKINIAANAKVYQANLTSTGCIKSWTVTTWYSSASSAPCLAATKKPGCSSGSATLAYVTKGVFAGKWVRIGSGVTYV
jgi:hypothetical protein